MKISIDKRFLRSGDIVEVTWDCQDVDSPRLVMHTGNHESILAIPSSGTKRFRIKQVHGMHWIGVKGIRGGRNEITSRRFLFVYGSPRTTDSFEYMDNPHWQRFKDYTKRWWSMYTPEKRRLYLLLLLLLAYQFVLSMWPEAGRIFFYLILFWVFWQVIKRD